jgi:hypothetical protein
MSNVASARVHALYGDPVKGMMLEPLESAALTEGWGTAEVRAVSGRGCRSGCARSDDPASLLSSVLSMSLGRTNFAAYARSIAGIRRAIAERTRSQELTRVMKDA